MRRIDCVNGDYRFHIFGVVRSKASSQKLLLSDTNIVALARTVENRKKLVLAYQKRFNPFAQEITEE